MALTAAIASAAEKKLMHEKVIDNKVTTNWEFVIDTVDTKVNVTWQTKQALAGAEVLLWDGAVAEDKIKPKIPLDSDVTP